jgi:hypothetical protein
MLADANVTFNALPWAGINTTIPMGFKCGLDGTYTITSEGIGSFRSGTQIFLEDKKENRTQELTLNPVYAFTHAASDDPARFILHFSNPFFGTEETSALGLAIYSSEDAVYVRNTGAEPLYGDVFVYDLLGRQVNHSKLNGDLITKIRIAARDGYYVVRVITREGTANQKVYLY